MPPFALRPLMLVLLAVTAAAQPTLVFNPPAGVAAKNKHVVFLTGDEEYRSEEALPMLAKILSQRHGFKCTVLFALDPDGTINPDNQKSLPGAEALDSRRCDRHAACGFRDWPDEQMKHFVDAYQRGVPIVALRTSTHAFNFPADSTWSKYTWNSNEPFAASANASSARQWVNHWGKHKNEATRGVIEPAREERSDPARRRPTSSATPTSTKPTRPPTRRSSCAARC